MKNKMFDPGTSTIVFLMTSPGMFYPRMGALLPPVLEACVHALLFSLFQSPSYSIQWGELSWRAQMWEYFLWFIPFGALVVLWMGRMQKNPLGN